MRLSCVILLALVHAALGVHQTLLSRTERAWRPIKERYPSAQLWRVLGSNKKRVPVQRSDELRDLQIYYRSEEQLWVVKCDEYQKPTIPERMGPAYPQLTTFDSKLLGNVPDALAYLKTKGYSMDILEVFVYQSIGVDGFDLEDTIYSFLMQSNDETKAWVSVGYPSIHVHEEQIKTPKVLQDDGEAGKENAQLGQG